MCGFERPSILGTENTVYTVRWFSVSGKFIFEERERERETTMKTWNKTDGGRIRSSNHEQCEELACSPDTSLSIYIRKEERERACVGCFHCGAREKRATRGSWRTHTERPRDRSMFHSYDLSHSLLWTRGRPTGNHNESESSERLQNCTSLASAAYCVCICSTATANNSRGILQSRLCVRRWRARRAASCESCGTTTAKK